MKIVILLGAPGSGKGTQADMLEADMGLKKLSTGDMLRAIAQQENDLASQIRAVMDSGGLVSDDLIIEVIRERMRQSDCADGVILDGFPRTLTQAKYLDNFLSNDAHFSDAQIYTIFVKVDDNLIIKRITGRFSCKACLNIYHDIFKPTQEEGVCDKCGSQEFIRRQDDNEEVIKKRLESYNNETLPIMEYYGKRDALFVINGENHIPNIYKELSQYIG